ncbi:MAG: hypothetical protein Q8L48_32750 [Archangium sp.]|nr:hypothetical protein [Archangium sp.]
MLNRTLVSMLLVLAACGQEAELSPAAPFTPQPLTFAGRTSNLELFATVVSGPDGVEAYLCDGEKDFWFRGSPTTPLFELTNDEGATLVLSLEETRVVGRLVEGDEVVTPFELPTVEGEVLFRAETGAGAERVLGGWIRLPDGEQRGAVRVGGTTFGSSLNPALQAACVGCAGLGLIPAPYTPSAVQRRPNQLQRFTIIGLGDSMMSGEGAPMTEGNLENFGRDGTQEEWSDGLPRATRSLVLPAPFTAAYLAANSARCHHGASGLDVAVIDLQRRWPRVDFVGQNFACSGAQTTTVVSPALPNGLFYSGPGGCGELTGAARADCLAQTDDLATEGPEQLRMMSTFLAANQLTADAVAISVGANDLGFANIIADCISSDCSAANSASRRLFATNAAALPARYATFARVLASTGVLPNNTYLSQYPNPLRRTANDLCAGLDFDDALLRTISDEEAAFATQTHGTINRLVAEGAAAARWHLVSSHVGTEAGHGLCATVPWFNDTTTALRTQGADLTDQTFGLVHTSAGMVHPNQQGQRDMYSPAWHAALEETLRERFTPRTPTGLRVTRMETAGNLITVTLVWNDVNTIETQSDLSGEGDLATPTTVSADADGTTVTVALRKPSTGTPKASFTLTACFDGPTMLCSAPTQRLEVEAVKPSLRPSSLSATVSLNPLQPGIRLTWSDRVPSKIFSTLELDRRGVVSREAVEGQTRLLAPTDGLTRFRVATCNTLGCSPVSPWHDFQRPTQSLPPPCVPPQQSRLDGCR